MKFVAYRSLAGVAGIVSAFAARQLVSALWRGEADPPLNPADRRISWKDALTWAVSAGIGAGVARLVAMRVTAAGWELATGDTPPGVAD